MTTVKDILQDADPLRHEPHRLEAERDRLRQAVVAAATGITTPRSASFHSPATVLAILAIFIVVILAIGSQIWSQGGATLQAAAIRFEMRLADDSPTAGFREVRIPGTDRVVYLDQEILVTNSDIAHSRVVQGNRVANFGIEVQFNAGGSQTMRRAMAQHVGRPVAILLDGEVVAMPVLRSPIGTSATISGDFTKADAERIANGIGVR